MRKLVRGLVKNLNSLALLGGAAAMAVGAGLIALPYGFLLGGGLAVAGAVLSIWGDSQQPGEGEGK